MVISFPISSLNNKPLTTLYNPPPNTILLFKRNKNVVADYLITTEDVYGDRKDSAHGEKGI